MDPTAIYRASILVLGGCSSGYSGVWVLVCHVFGVGPVGAGTFGFLIGTGLQPQRGFLQHTSSFNLY